MTPYEWGLAKKLFDEALSLPPEQQQDFVTTRCANPELRLQLMSLLDSQASSDFTAGGESAAEREGEAWAPQQGDLLCERFLIGGLLGVGGYGRVYEAEDRRLKGDTVAVKVLRPEISRNKKALARLNREFRLSRKVTHPNVCRVFDIGEHVRPGTGEIVFLTMELLRGETLETKLRQAGPSSPGEALPLICQMAAGLSAAHDERVIHRDFKPGNVILVPKEPNASRVVITDFGLARRSSYDETASDLRSADVVGTPAYMAPEQLLGHDLDVRADVYAFGLVVFELLTGHRPFDGNSVFEIAQKRLTEEPLSLRRLAPSLPEEWERAVVRCLERDPNQRFPSMGEAVRGFEAPTRLDSNATPIRLPDARASAVSNRAARPSPLLLFLTAALVMASVAALFFWAGRSPTDNATRPPVAEEVRVMNSVVVMPFSLEAEEDDSTAFVAEGIRYELISGLARSDAKVIAGDTATVINEKGLGVKAIGNELGVDGVIRGQIVRHLGRFRVRVELIDAQDESYVWAETYDVGTDDYRVVDKALAAAVLIGMGLPLPEHRREPAKAVSNEAHELYLRGRYSWNKRTDEGIKTALDYFERAVVLEPKFAKAYAGIADCFTVLGDKGLAPPREVMPKAKAAALKALELDGALGEAHASLGLITDLYDWDWGNAESSYRRAVELDPNLKSVRQWYASLLMRRQRFDEAMREATHALALDPLSAPTNNFLGWIYFFSRDYHAAIQQLQATLQIAPDYTHARVLLSRAYARIGRSHEAISEARRAAEEMAETNPLLAERYQLTVEAVVGERSQALERLRSMVDRQGYRQAALISMAYAELGLDEKAFEWFDRAYEERDTALLYIGIDPSFDRLRSDPRYVARWQKLGLF